MTVECITEKEIKNNIENILKHINGKNETLLITLKGRAVATMLSLKKYKRLISELEDKLDENDTELIRDICEAKKQYRSGNAHPLKK